MNEQFYTWKDELYNASEPMQTRDQTWWVEGCDFIGMFENLENDVRKIQDELDLPNRLPTRMNESSHQHYSEYYDEDSIKFVFKHNRQTIERFGYEFCES